MMFLQIKRQMNKKKRLRKKIKDVTYDDLLLVWDFDEAKFTWAKPLWIRQEEISKSFAFEPIVLVSLFIS